jgi:hypothetical protein
VVADDVPRVVEIAKEIGHELGWTAEVRNMALADGDAPV